MRILLAALILACLLMAAGASASTAVGRVAIDTPASEVSVGNPQPSPNLPPSPPPYYPEEKPKEAKKEEPKKEEPKAEVPKKPKALFDISLSVGRRSILPADKLVLVTKLVNIGRPGKINATVRYLIRNDTGIPLHDETIIVPLETQSEFTHEINVSTLPLGHYKVLANLTYEDQEQPAVSEDSFSIVKKITALGTLKDAVGAWMRNVSLALRGLIQKSLVWLI